MQLWKLTGKDDRGARVVFHDPMYGRSSLSPKEREVFSGPNHKTTELALLSIVAVILLFQIGRSIMSEPATQALIKWAFAAVFTAIIFFVLLPPIRFYLWDVNWKAKYKEIGRCPACQFEIKACEPQADGCTVCPECSGAWRIRRTNTISSSHQRESS